MELVSHKQDFSNIKIFREILKMIQKFQNNFGVRGIISCEKEGLLEAYLQNFYQYTIFGFQSGKMNVITELMAYLNQVW